MRAQNERILIYVATTVVGALGVTYASVPLYKVFCQATGFGGTTQRDENMQKLSTLAPVSRLFVLGCSWNNRSRVAPMYLASCARTLVSSFGT
jgi:cytochrome c oxidase assembly protein Cox11